MRNLTQNTDYSVQVRQILLPSGRTSGLSAPIAVHTPVFVAPTRPGAVTNLRATNATSDTATLSWSPSSAPGVTYRVYLNGNRRDETTTGTSLVVGPVLVSPTRFPGPV